MKYYYLLNGKIMVANEKVPLENDADTLRDYKYIYDNWYSSLQPCEISESELDNVKNYLCHNAKFEDFNPHEQIEVTDIVRLEEIKTITKSGTITDYQLFFKHPEQVGEIEAVEFAEWILDNTAGVIGTKQRNYYVKGLLHGKYTTKQLYEMFKNQK